MTSDDRILAYLAGELDPWERQAFEARLAQEPALRQAVDDWIALAQARQLDHNHDEPGRARRQERFLDALASLEPAAPQPPARKPRGSWWQRLAGRGPFLPLGWGLAAVLAVMLVLPAGPERGVLTRGADAGCVRWSADVPDTVSAGELREILTQFAVVIVGGPQRDGRFVFAAPRESALHEAMQALGATASRPLAPGPCGDAPS